MLLPLFIACTPAPTPPASAAPKPASVEVARVREGQLSDTWSILGEVRALERAELAAGAAGAIQLVSSREGDAVTEGSLVVEVDSGLALAELATAKAEEHRLGAELAQAKRTLARVGRVVDGVMAANEVEQLDTRVKALEAQVEGAEANARLAQAKLNRHRIRAPFAGVVSKRHVDPGDWVNPGTPVLDLVRADTVEIRVDAPLELAQRVHVGDTVNLVDGAFGKVVGVVPALDPISRTSVIRVAPTGQIAGLLPGSSMSIDFNVQMSGGVVVPRDALVPGPSETRVFRVVDGTAQVIVVRTLATTAEEVLVEAEGLAPGDMLVVRGNERLRPDQPVQVL